MKKAILLIGLMVLLLGCDPEKIHSTCSINDDSECNRYCESNSDCYYSCGCGCVNRDQNCAGNEAMFCKLNECVCENNECSMQNEIIETPAGPFIPEWIDYEIVEEEEILELEIGTPVEITGRIEPLLGEVEDLFYVFEVTEGLEIIEGDIYPEKNFKVKLNEPFETKIKVVANTEIESGWISFEVNSRYPLDDIKERVEFLGGDDFLEMLKDDLNDMESTRFFGWDALEVKTK